MRISRPCYDKPHRCPGWAGGGTRYARVDRCDNGRVRTRVPYPEFPGEFETPGAKRWRFGHCDTCDVVTWPYVTRHLDWRHWGWTISRLRFRVRDLRWRFESRRDEESR